jgi:hypothetical protein
MKTLDLTQHKVTIEDLLGWATSDLVLIRARDGHEFILEEVDDFAGEVAMLGSNEKFMQFLAERSQESGTISLDEVENALINRA